MSIPHPIEICTLWQSESWERFQHSLGHETHRIHDVLLFVYPLFFGFRYAYIPRGPALLSGEFHTEFQKLAKRRKIIFLRIDPPSRSDVTQTLSHDIKVGTSPQPRTTLVLDLSLSEQELLTQMKRKGRYNIQLASKKGVSVRKPKNLQKQKEYIGYFFKLLSETTHRDGFSGHDRLYYEYFLREIPESEIFLAFLEDQPLAAGIFVFQEKTCWYYYGASGSEHSSLMAPYLLQWTAILEAKKRGCHWYDFLGIAEENSPKDHPWSGITEFKKKFGGITVHFPSPVHLVLRSFWYQVYQLAKFFQQRMIRRKTSND